LSCGRERLSNASKVGSERVPSFDDIAGKIEIPRIEKLGSVNQICELKNSLKAVLGEISDFSDPMTNHTLKSPQSILPDTDPGLPSLLC
jgi:hypothetical protein